ncbi:hypothetical protein [Thermodesulforhabdus norvegica]|uniref:Uncharacterized protein n=1 Tax=Thermodesulforhabdus norvegica TaxID=39841 RepID=A0A1I4SRF1_9BACT|nr:hypothetical protein [Thermodesulforhabdus norvegica]SFM67012.1 hypothetical protein SAMN05660836_01122 [Thermodesulforhabdus norvegica]
MSLFDKIFLFPFTVLPESFYRFASLVLPSVNVLEVLRPPQFPPWNRGELRAFRVIKRDEDRRKIAAIYRGYQDLARVHGEKHLIDTISLLKEHDEWEESRLRLRSAIRTPEENKVSDEWVRFVEAALIMELARDLDERDIELDADLSKVHELESQFRLSLGLEEEFDEDVDDSVRITAEHLPQRSYFGYMIPKRITSWLRLYRQAFIGEPLGAPVLLCVTREVVEELVDPLRTKIERAGGEWKEEFVFNVRVINVFEKMAVEEFEKFRTEVLKYDRRPFWDALARFVDEPELGDVLSELKTEALRFSELLNKSAEGRSGSTGFFEQVLEFGACCYPQVSFQNLSSAFLSPAEEIFVNDDRPLVVLFLDERIVEKH